MNGPPSLDVIARPRVEIITARTLLEQFRPIESIVDGLPIGRGALVSLTAPTGHGKTTVAALLQVALCRGHRFAGREVTQGDVLVLAGENPDDFVMHLAATLQDDGLTADDVSANRGPFHGTLYAIPGAFELGFELDDLARRLDGMGDRLVCIIVDTSAAFFAGADENDNVSMRQHASMLRALTALPGRPTVIVLCHPTKNATRDSLFPRGGGAYLAEVDANLTLWKDDSGIVTLHWAGKIRGPSFEPIRFELEPIELAGYRDCRGKPIWSVAARHLPDDLADELHARAADDDDRLLLQLQLKPGASVRELASACGWTNGSGKPIYMRADRRLRHLLGLGLTEQDRHGKWRLTSKGSKEANRLP